MAVKRHVLRSELTQELREKILSGEFPPGESLREERLAGEMGVSRTPVREALRQLTEEGFLDYIPNRGATVIKPTVDVIREILETRESLEGSAAREAARLMAQSKLDKLRHDLESLRDSAAQGDHSEIGEDIHSRIFEACGNTRLQRLATLYFVKTKWINRFSGQIPGRMKQSYQEHFGILCALEARDPEWAEMAMRGHIRSCLKDILRTIDRDDSLAQHNPAVTPRDPAVNGAGEAQASDPSAGHVNMEEDRRETPRTSGNQAPYDP